MIPVLGIPAISPGRLADALASVDVEVDDFVFVDNSRDGLDVPPTPWAKRRWVLRMPSNLGVATSWNLIVKATPFAPWWLIAPTDLEWTPGALETIADEVPQTGVLTGGGAVDWAWFALPSETVAQVGLFDEHFHPIYCEDIDYGRRLEQAGMRRLHTSANVRHWNSTTINKDGFKAANNRTYHRNREYLRWKWEDDAAPKLSPGWDLRRRRELTWDTAR